MARVFLLCLLLVACVPPAAMPRSEAGSALYILSNLAPLEGIRRLEGIAYGTHPRQKLDVYLPLRLAESRGIVVFGYGGGYKDGNRDEYRFIGHTFAELGLVTIVYDYRLYPEVRFPTYLEDAALALRWAYDHAADYGADKQAIVLAGHSAGAHIAALLATNPKYLERVQLQPRQLRLVLCLGGAYQFWSAQGGFISPDIAEVMQGASPLETQPIEFLSAASADMVLMHGINDQILPIGQARAFVQKALSLGAPVRLLEYPGDHASTVINLSATLRFRSRQYADSLVLLRAWGLLE
ncbi:MAG: alpha/beta hydrolase [Deinococcales bacterium]